MKKLITILFITGCLSSFGQTSTKNYIKTYTAREAISSTLAGNSDPNQTSQTVQYFDGLGRPEQTIERWGSSITQSLIIPFEYDVYGRQVKQHLPVPYSSTSTNFVNNGTVLSSGNTYYTGRFGVADANASYGNRTYESSPLNRVLSTSSPGADWHANPVEFQYQYNSASENIKKWVWNDLQLSAESFYPANELYKNIITDEDNNQTIEYFDKQGRTIVKKSQTGDVNDPWAETYYIYDEFDRLRVVLPPQSNKAVVDYYEGLSADGFTIQSSNHTITSAETSDKLAYTFGSTVTVPDGITLTPGSHIKPLEVLTPDFLADWAFQYEYDGRGRMISRQVPGAEKVLMVYDDWDRLVLIQDGVQRASNEWLFTKYDALNRPVMTGIMTGGDEVTVRSAAANPANTRGESFSSGGTNQYTNNTYPTANLTYLSVIYYDNYDWDNTGLTFSDPLSQLTHHTAVKGQVTGIQTKTENGSWIKRASYYDEKYRLIQTRSTNHLNGTDAVTNYYDFIGQVTKTISSHNDGTTTIDITKRYEYDHLGRILNAYHQINNESEVLLSSNTYTAIGELEEKDLHGGEQSMDYTYNIRGWLRSINDSGLSSAGDTNTDLFGIELHYNNNPLDNTREYMSGNISAIKWSDHVAAGSNNTRAYTYGYDKLNRLTNADHLENNVDVGSYDVDISGYDLNGNITQLKRRSENVSSYMDDLSYTYKGNQLKKVDDAGDDGVGFTEITTGDDYTYDANGNMIFDNNKGISSIEYNHLNLPVKVTFDAGNYIEYLYDAAGIKLQQKVYQTGNLANTTDYVGEFVYVTLGTGTRKLELIQHEEGRLIYDDYGHDWDYQYHLKDHLGNTRLTFSTLSMDPLVCVETFETGEDNGFQNLNRHLNSSANTTSGGNEVELLTSGETGAMVLLAVNEGDEVSMIVQANYENAPTNNNFLGTTFNSLFTAFDNVYGSGTEGGLSVSSQEFDDAINGTAMGGKDAAGTAPRAFLNYIYFDENMQYVTAGFQQVTTAALGTGVHEAVSINNILADRNGYILAYLSNENSEALDMHFDDFTVTQIKTPVIQSDDYYPFGLTFNKAQRIGSTVNWFGYNGGTELNSSLGLEWSETPFRVYNPSLGRFIQQDLLADFIPSINHYNYAFNNPIALNDPTGLIPESFLQSLFDAVPAGQNASFSGGEVRRAYNYWESVNGKAYGADFNGKELWLYNVESASFFEDGDGNFAGAKVSVTKPISIAVGGSIGEIGTGESFIPIWGSGRQAYNMFAIGNVRAGILHSVVAITDVFGAGYAAKTLAKGTIKLGSRLAAKGSQTIGSRTIGAARAGFTRAPWRLTKSGASEIKSHTRFGTFYKSKSDGLWWALDRAGHGGSRFKVFKEGKGGLEWYRDADEFGDFIFNKYKGPVGKSIPWSEFKTVK